MLIEWVYYLHNALQVCTNEINERLKGIKNAIRRKINFVKAMWDDGAKKDGVSTYEKKNHWYIYYLLMHKGQ